MCIAWFRKWHVTADFLLIGSMGIHFNKNAHSQIFNISGALVGNKIVDRSDVVGASPVGVAPTTSSSST